MERRQRSKNTLTHLLKMTEKEARQVIADLAADFIANPYNLERDLYANYKGYERCLNLKKQFLCLVIIGWMNCVGLSLLNMAM